MNQREAIYEAVTDLVEAEADTPVSLTDDERKEVHRVVMVNFTDGKATMTDEAKKKYADPKELSKYVSSLINNWLRKDPKLNGGVKYVAKNPGSRAGQGDAQLRELRKLLKINEGTSKAETIQTFIDQRITLIATERKKTIQVDYSQIPPELRDLVNESNEDESAA